MGFGRFLRHAAQDAEGIVDPRNYIQAGKMLVTNPVGFGEAFGKSYLNLARHPIRSFESNPFSSALAVLPVAGGLGAAAKGGRVAVLARSLHEAGVAPEEAANALRMEAVKVTRGSTHSMPDTTPPTLPTLGHHPGGIRPPGRPGDNMGFSMHRLLGEAANGEDSTMMPGLGRGIEMSPIERLKAGEKISGGAQREHPITGRDYPDSVSAGARGQGTTGPAQYMTNSPQWGFIDQNRTHPGYDSNGMVEPAETMKNSVQGYHLPIQTDARHIASFFRRDRTAPGHPQIKAISDSGMFPDVGFRFPKGLHAKGKGGNPLASPEMQSFLRNAQSNADLEETMAHFRKSRPNVDHSKRVGPPAKDVLLAQLRNNPALVKKLLDQMGMN